MTLTSEPQSVYSRHHTAPEAERDVLARIYSLAVQKLRETKEGGRPTAPENAERSLNAVRVEDIIQERP